MTRTAAVALHGTTHVVRIATVRGAGGVHPRARLGTVAAQPGRPARRLAALLTRWAGTPRRRLDHEQHALLVLHQDAARAAARGTASGSAGHDEWALRGMLR